MDQQVKSINTDSRSNKRLRYASSKQRSKRASADVYRSYKRRIGVTSAASREERVHHPHREESKRANKRQKKQGEEKGEEDAGKKIVSKRSTAEDVDVTEATFSEELDLANDRNPSETFRDFYREVWPLSRSLPEVLHHASTIIDSLLAYMLSNASEPHVKSTNITTSQTATSSRERFVLNHASADILHLLAVLAKDVRHEIHPYLHTQIMPRIVTDLLNQPTIDESDASKQFIPLDVSLIEAAFRTMSYIFRYDAEALLAEVSGSGKDPCLETLRQYYGSTLAHRRDVVRRLAAETFAPLVRKLKQDSARRRHLRRVLKALITVSTRPATATASAKRIQANAMDGISHFFFEISRGVAGQLHSKGLVAVKVLLDAMSSDSGKDNMSASSRELIHSVTSSFLDKLCQHLDRQFFGELVHEITSTTQRLIKKTTNDDSELGFGPQQHMARLLNQLVLFRDGCLLQAYTKTNVDLLKSILGVLDVMVPLFTTLPDAVKEALLSLLCSTWKGVPTDDQFARRVRKHVNLMVVSPSIKDSTSTGSPAQTLARDLIPHLPSSVAMGVVGSAILSAAAKVIEHDVDAGLSLVLSISQSKPSLEEEGESGMSEDSLFSLEGAGQCHVPSQVKQKLIETCLLPLSEGDLIHSDLNRLGVACRCISFVAVVEVEEDEGENTKARKALLEKGLKWLLNAFSYCAERRAGSEDKDDYVIAASLALESFASLSTEMHKQNPDSSSVKKMLCKAQKPVEALLLSHSASLWTLKCGAAFVESLQLFDLSLDQRDAIFDALVLNLRSSSHFRRLYSLKILASLPKKHFVTDHADIDFTDDLDEEGEAGYAGTVGKKLGNVVRAGLCDIVDTMLAIESTPIAFENERELLSLISRIEILGRTAKLPVIYTEAAGNHMLGILNIKFAPVWPAAVRAFVSLAKGQNTFEISPLKDEISKSMNKFPIAPLQATAPLIEDEVTDQQVQIADHHSLCRRWAESNGVDVTLFGKDVSDHLPTDDATVLQHLWSVLEGAPQLLLKHNRKFIPIFLEFMHSQYYSFYSHDPDSRELCIVDHVDDKKQYDRQILQGHLLHQRLTSLLKVFAAVKGPKQLFKHNLLLSIYMSLLGQETAIAKLAFSCIQTYKLGFLAYFSENIEALFAKGGLREGLLTFVTALESSEYDKKERHRLIPLVMRVLFGRLSARTGGNKSSKDSPAARRAAVLSFIAVMCQTDEELYPFLYLMIRSYVPASCQLVPIEQHNEAFKAKVLSMVTSVSADDLASLPVQVHVGFLHLLEPVVGQLGHRVSGLVHQFTSIMLVLCKAAEIKQPSSTELLAAGEDENVEDNEVEMKSTKGFGTIRTLCFRRLSEVFAQFSRVVNFAVYGPSLWDSIKRSVRMLPQAVVHCDKVPALLSLMETLSGHPQLEPLLSIHDDVAPCVIKCLAETSSHPVMDSTLSFIDNLLTDHDSGLPEKKACLAKQHVDLILCQFMLRLGSKVKVDGQEENPSGSSNRNHNGNNLKRSVTWRRELRILCRITEIVEDTASDGVAHEDEVAAKLCTLLVPYLEHGNGVTEIDQMNVLKILEALISRVGTEAGETYFKQLARLLGPMKGKSGIVSIQVRQGIASVLSKTPQDQHHQAAKVSMALKKLCKSHAKRIDEMDYDSVVPALNNLIDSKSDSSWQALATVESEIKTSLISPLLSTCLHYLFNDDGVVARGSFKALKTLVGLSAELAGLNSDNALANDLAENEWFDLLEKSLVPAVRVGLGTRNVSTRRFYILLMAECAAKCKNSSKPNLYGDLSVLIRDDEPDLDFFLNITHVQMHRRARAFQRLRKLLVPSEDASAPFSLQSLSNVLLPLALHPVYESKTKAEEPFAIEAIATVGAISRHLSWSKYSSILWTSLTQFHRHTHQERYLIGMICAVVDGFHFDISEGRVTTQTAGEAQEGENAIWRALEKRFVPKIETLLVKESVDRNGNKLKSLRSSLILALVKLFKKFKREIFESRLPRLLTVVCDGLKSRESDSRDVARTTLAKLAADVDISYLPDILREVTLALHEGFRLHVRMATVHTILLALSEVYHPPASCSEEQAMNMPFDRSVPALMDIIQQDLFGMAQERKDVVGAQTRYVKEAGGSKSQNSIEQISALIVFRPSLANMDSQTHSSIHAIVSPLLERLKAPNVEVVTIRRVKECLTRVVVGLSRNPSTTIAEVLPFVYATAAPFIGIKDLESEAQYKEDSSDDEDDNVKPLRVSGSSTKKAKPDTAVVVKTGSVVSWRPSALKSSKTSREASDVRQKESYALRKVQDGVSAPKLTGSSRYASAALTSRINDPANIGAVVFSLRLLHSILKKKKLTASEPNLVSLVDPFVPLLTACVCTCRETDVVLLALRCLGIFLVFDLPSKDGCAPSLASKTLELLGTSGVGSSQDNDLSQACFKMLILLMNIDQSKVGKTFSASEMIEHGEGVLSGSNVLPLDSEQMKILVSYVRESIIDSDNHNAALNLVRAMMSRRFVSPEFYDLMDTVLELSVRSARSSLRQQCAGIVVNFLLNYPIGDERLEDHLKQIVMNVKYEFEEGRLSGINLITMVVDKVPEPVLEKHVQLFFLPLTLQLINDTSEKCREGVASCLSRLLRRVSTDVIHSLYDFAIRWSEGNDDVQRASLQLFRIFVDTCGEFMKRGNTATDLVERLNNISTKQAIAGSNWEVFYFALLCLEKLVTSFPSILANQPELWGVIVRCLAHSHPFVKLVSSRLVLMHLESLDKASFVKKNKTTFLVQIPGSLHEIARNLCFQMNSEESQQSEEITALCIKSLCWILPVMKEHPILCYSDDEEFNEETSNPVGWVMKRISSMARPRGPKRRQSVFKAFGAFATKCPDVVFPQHLEFMIEPLHRVDVETVNDAERPQIVSQRRRGPAPEGEGIPEEASLARDVLRLLEEKCDSPDAFLRAYATVKTRARERKENRKLELKSEAVRDPAAAAKRRQDKNEKEKKRKKRRVEDRRRERGALGKGRRRYAD